MPRSTRLAATGALLIFIMLITLGAMAPVSIIAQNATPTMAVTVVVTPQPTSYEVMPGVDPFFWSFYVINTSRPFTLTETLVASWYQPHPDVVGIDLRSMDQCELAELVPDWGCWLDVEVIVDGPGACDLIIWPDPIKYYYRVELQFNQPETGPLHGLCWFLYWQGEPSNYYCYYRDNDPLHQFSYLYLKAQDKVIYLPLILKW